MPGVEHRLHVELHEETEESRRSPRGAGERSVTSATFTTWPSGELRMVFEGRELVWSDEAVKQFAQYLADELHVTATPSDKP